MTIVISKQSSTCSRGAGIGHPMGPVVSVQIKNFSGDRKELAKVLGADDETKSHFTLTTPWNLASLVRNYHGIIVRRHHTDQKQMGLESSLPQ